MLNPYTKASRARHWQRSRARRHRCVVGTAKVLDEIADLNRLACLETLIVRDTDEDGGRAGALVRRALVFIRGRIREENIVEHDLVATAMAAGAGCAVDVVDKSALDKMQAQLVGGCWHSPA